MLRIIAFLGGVVLSASALASDPYKGLIYYSPDTIPSCIVDYDDDDYREWRGGIPASNDSRRDIGTLYERFQSRYLMLISSLNIVDTQNGTKYKAIFKEALCARNILFSVELARVMNLHGPDVRLLSLWAGMSLVFKRNHLETAPYGIDAGVFDSMLRSVLVDVQSRLDSALPPADPSKPYEGSVDFSSSRTPSCRIYNDHDHYREWWGGVPVSNNVQGDIDMLYKQLQGHYLEIVSNLDDADVQDSTKYRLAFEDALCTGGTLYSVELTRVMKFYGPDVSLANLWDGMSSAFRENHLEAGPDGIDAGVFGSMLQSVLVDLQSGLE